MNEIEWVKNFLQYPDLDECKIINIYRFTLIWNLFETKCCNKDAKISKVSEYLENTELNFSSQIILKVWKHFKTRYVKNNDISDSFNSFEFKNDSIKESVKTILKKENPTLSEKLDSLLKICFRLRNNLYHGEKAVEKLYQQNKNFEMANTFLMELIEVKTNRRIN